MGNGEMQPRPKLTNGSNELANLSVEGDGGKPVVGEGGPTGTGTYFKIQFRSELI